jgi:Concanavalin A-like lectin/glucanases superfamily
MGSFQQVGFTADGAQLRLYANGVEVASTDYQGAINAPGIPWLSMGARLNNDDQDPPVLGPDGTNPNYLSGPLDDLGIWNRRLTADELSQIFAIGKQGKPLTDVVVVPPVDPVISSVTANADGSVTVTYAGGVLEASPSLAGPYVPVQGASSPYTFTPTTPNWFGRVRN